MRYLPTVVAAALALGLSAATAQDQTEDPASEAIESFDVDAADATEPESADTAEVTEAEGGETNEADAIAELPSRPADAPKVATVQADLAECSAMLSAMSGASTSFVERDRLRGYSGEWLSVASRIAGEGSDIMTMASARAEEWSGKVQSLRFLSPHKAWLEYCGSLAAEHGLDPAPFTSRMD